MKGNSRNIKNWTKNRLNAYYGSRLHFLRALFSDSLNKENFKISGCKLNPDTHAPLEENPLPENTFLIKHNSTLTSLYYHDPVLVRYTSNHTELETGILGFHPTEDRSTIQFNDTLHVYKNGYFDNPYAVTWGGKLGNERIADMLPFDYLPYSSVNDISEEEIIKSPIENHLLSRQRSQSPDQLFVHLDRNMYNPGDTIYFHAYIRDRFTNEFESKSVSFYALLFDNNNRKVDSSRFRIDRYETSGWMTIPSNAVFGKYHFIAFTSIMQNFNPSDAFQTEILVKVKDLNSVESDNSIDTEYFEIRFLPEGGNSVIGIQQKIGFNATDYRGLPVQFTGLLKNSSGWILDTLKSGKYGPGTFVCTPEKGMYVEVIKGTNQEKIWPLPEPSPSGVCLSVHTIDDRSFFIEIQANNYSNDTVIVLGVMNSTQIFSRDLILNNKQGMVVETEQLPSGVAEITIMDKNLKPLAERLYYINAYKHLVFNIKTGDDQQSQGKETELSVLVTDGQGNTAEGIFSIAVVDSVSGYNAEIFSPGIEYSFNYGSSFAFNLPPKVLIKGLENLTDEERDLLLLVYGWRKYNWDFKENQINSQLSTNYDLINIKILNNLMGHPSSKNLDLVSLEGPSAVHLSLKNSDEISLPLDSLTEITRTVTLVPASKDKKKVMEASLSIPFNAEYFNPKYLITTQPTIPKEIFSIHPIEHKIPFDETAIEIPEVTIKGYPRIQKIYQNIYEERYKYANVISSNPELLHRSFYLETVVRTLSNPFIINEKAVYFRFKTSFIGGAVPALIVLDGMPIYENGWQIAKTIPMSDIASVSIIKGNQGRTIYGLDASGGVIFINTMFHNPTLRNLGAERKSKNKADNMLLPINIFRSNIEFYSPTKFDIDNDPIIQKGSTYYWNPEIYFDGKEPVKIKYINRRHTGPVLITINGASVNNLIGTGKASYWVK